MNIIYISHSDENNLTRSYHITNDDEDDIGTVEAYGNEYGELVSVVKIYNPRFQRAGLGFDAFKKVFDEINANVPITIIKGSWHSGGEFQDFEDGMSTNLKVYKDHLNTNNSEQSAFLTPTGKWAEKLGFKVAEIILDSQDEVLVNFKIK